jgi:hypothetical protein
MGSRPYPPVSDNHRRCLGVAQMGRGTDGGRVDHARPVGILANQVWSFTGSNDRPNESKFLTQYSINYNFGQGWYLTSAPILTADWQAANGNKWTVPVGGGFGKVFRIGKLPINANCGYYANVVHPDPAADWTFRLQIALLLPKAIFQ